jgi:hypothetical protein
MIEPALTPQEWEENWKHLPQGVRLPAAPDTPDEWWGTPHRIAALALYGQPFGFTHEDVVLLRSSSWDVEEGGEALRMLASRIKALLPPEKE